MCPPNVIVELEMHKNADADTSLLEKHHELLVGLIRCCQVASRGGFMPLLPCKSLAVGLLLNMEQFDITSIIFALLCNEHPGVEYACFTVDQAISQFQKYLP